MNRVVYGAPPSNTPAGGVKVIYRHSELLRKIGVDSAVWHPGASDFKCTWFENQIITIDTENLSPKEDFIILPEIWASNYVSSFKRLGFRVGIFVQNCYYTHFNLNSENKDAIENAYQEADIIMSISQDTTKYLRDILRIPEDKIILQRYSVDAGLFKSKNKSKLITYMPRKMGQHSSRVISELKRLIPSGWEIRALDGLSEIDIANNLSESIIFLAFSEFEGLPVPPVEAALSGNIVIGYHGQGGREYWLEPNFIEIQQGDIQAFIEKTLRQINLINLNKLNLEDINHNIEKIQNYFSSENEKEMLINLVKRIGI